MLYSRLLLLNSDQMRVATEMSSLNSSAAFVKYDNKRDGDDTEGSSADVPRPRA